MNLHQNKELLKESIQKAANSLNMRETFVEKDFWITLILNNLSNSKYSDISVFKGGTSLAKGYNLIKRFSEDIDIAVKTDDVKSGNKMKNIIRKIEKEIARDITEIHVDGVTSKGSRYRKSVHKYDSIYTNNINNKLIIEINSFANPYPYSDCLIKSKIYDFLDITGNIDIIQQYNLQPFKINVLNKEQTLLEKMVSLIRFSFDEKPVENISNKIRHFYDLYFLANDIDCIYFIKSEDFKIKFNQLLNHDKELFSEPLGWRKKSITVSPLITDFDNIWKKIKSAYKTEISALAYSEIPDEEEVANSFKYLIKRII
ncbi:MAG: hypothetical protein APR63_05670 [Desulfuromonas sp. SDB]|nr:MAG: hypothetical protein APR63_05670 [Desulfuromonas sp. SDB]